MKKQISFKLATLPIIVLVISSAFSILVWKAGMHIPLLIGIIVAALIAFIKGWKWDEIQKMLVDGVARALPAVFILLIIGIIVGTWIGSGVIPTIIYYGLSMINPAFFVPLVALITGIISITLGSSFTSIATIGIAFMAIGKGLGFNPGLIAGAVISGAYFGDKLSPLSDTTNIAPAMTETDLFSHVKHMLWDTLPAFLIAVVMYWFFGNMSISGSSVDTSKIDVIMNGLSQAFVINPLLLLMPIFTIILMIKKMPAIPALVMVGGLGAILQAIVQRASITTVVQTMTSGYSAQTGVKAVDALLNKGGMISMLEIVALLILASALGGVLEETKVFDVLTNKIMNRVHSTGGLISATLASTFLIGFASGAQMLAIILPARTFVNKYKELGIDTTNLSRCVEAGGTVGINLVPWSVPAVFALNVLGVAPVNYIPFAFFIILVPLINLLFGFTGWTITKTNKTITEPEPALTAKEGL